MGVGFLGHRFHLGNVTGNIFFLFDHIGDVATPDILLQDQLLLEIDRIAFRDPDMTLLQILI